MYNTVKNLIKVLTRKQKIKLLLLQFLIIISAVLEVVTILIFGPFMALIGNTEYYSSVFDKYSFKFRH
jgi:hypothetical protein